MAHNVVLHSRYLRDSSFENPAAPALPGDPAPAFDIDVGVDGRRRGNMHEVTLSVQVTARREEKVSFLIELHYAGLFEIDGLDEGATRRFLFTEAPRLLFPFVDRICADTTRDGGLPPLALSPPDFNLLYQSRVRSENGHDPAAPAVALPEGGRHDETQP